MGILDIDIINNSDKMTDILIEAKKSDIMEFLDRYYLLNTTRLHFRLRGGEVYVDYYGYPEEGYILCHGDSITGGLFKWGVVFANFVLNPGNKCESLEGCPYTVVGDFSILSGSYIKELTGSPLEVSNFKCIESKIKNLKGITPNVVKYDMSKLHKILDYESILKYEKLTGELFTLTNYVEYTGFPKILEDPVTHMVEYTCTPGDVIVNRNQYLESLEGCPEHLYILDCSSTSIKDFKGCPEYVSIIYADECGELKSFKYVSQSVNRILAMNCHNLTTLEHIGKHICYLNIRNCINLTTLGEGFTYNRLYVDGCPHEFIEQAKKLCKGVANSYYVD